ncbi:SH3 domain-containing protein [Mesorhizobium sp. B2-5-3]|uniref:SH3 domain-containing protein n=1 Tax=Mesorhizobium sp. B2-5-3 TaxID=2589927 RepID=UPI001FEF153E|nr:SH3 domain-containing protein [Mesorhizobium sp. B2-5-3]
MRFRFLLCLATILAAILGTSAAAFAYNAHTTTNLNVRSGPGAGYAKVGTLPVGYRVNVTGCQPGLVQNPWRRPQRLGQFRLSLAGPCRSPASDHRAPAASSAALAASAAPSSAPSPAAQTASREVQDRTEFLLQIADFSGVTRQDVVTDRNHRLRFGPVQAAGFWATSVMLSGARRPAGTSGVRAR